MYRVVHVEWLGYEEADLICWDGIYQVRCFSHPCKHQIGDTLNETLFCMFSDDVMRTSKRYGILAQNGMYLLSGKVTDKKEKLLRIGGFTFQLEYLPGDIHDHEFVEVACGRIDI